MDRHNESRDARGVKAGEGGHGDQNGPEIKIEGGSDAPILHERRPDETQFRMRSEKLRPEAWLLRWSAVEASFEPPQNWRSNWRQGSNARV